MSGEFATAYEAPTSLDAGRVLGARPMRPTLWMFCGFAGALPIFIAALFLAALVFAIKDDRNYDLEQFLSTSVTILVIPTVLLEFLCLIMAQDWGGRPAEHWVRVISRFRRLPRTFASEHDLHKHHVKMRVENSTLIDQEGTPRAVVEVSTLNLRMTDEDTLSSHIKKLHAFYVALRWPIQIVVRAWLKPDGLIHRRWFIAISADTNALLEDRITDIVAGLKRAGLDGRPLNGDLFDTLQECWSSKTANSQLGPRVLERRRTHVVIDGEIVRGFVLTKIPRIVDPNWLAPLLDGKLPVDLSMWLEPVDNVIEQDNLLGKINAWETAQVLRENSGSYRDPDIDDQIRDAQRTRLLLRRPGQLRVFLATIGFAVRGPSLEVAGDRERQVIDHLREHIGPDPVLPIDYEHDFAPLFSVPTGIPPISYPLRMVTPMLARTYPFSSSSLTMPGGIRCGTSKGSQRDNSLDVWSLTNPHIVVLATTGAGKGYWVKIYLWRLMQMFKEHRVWIIQAEKDEYSALAESMPAFTYKQYTSDQVKFMNPMHQPYMNLSDSLGGAVIRIEYLDELDDKMYAHKGSHSLRGAQLTVYDLTRMKPDDRGTAISRILRILEQSAEREHLETHGTVVVDELGIVLRSQEAAQAIETGYRRFRSIPHRDNPRRVSRRGMIGISQRPSDVLNHTLGKVIADLSETHVYLRQKSTELRNTRAVLNLNSDEVEYLELAEDGDALLIAGRSRVGLHLYATDAEHQIAKT